MALTAGSRIGPFEIVSRIGAGGMGEVFRARDTKLGRDVAIKVLPAAYAQDRERVARFRREAHLVASLNHVNIAAIYGLEETGGVVALALELVEGEDLAQHLMRGPLPVDEARAIARQIAEGLEAAHEKGIIHRDLKPANVKLTNDGTVKILDFGLAKAYQDDPATGGGFENSPTMARPMTEAGVILGTAAYMSPEQARGKAVDKRSDIWSFGVLLFEMLTARRLFAGETVSDTLAAVLREDVDLSALPDATPPSLRRILERCLQRDPKQRLRDIGEVRLALSDPSGHAAAIAPQAAPSAAPRRRGAVWVAATLIAVAAAMVSVRAWTRFHPPAVPQVTRFTIPLPPGQVLAGNSGPAISRDGRLLAYVVRDTAGVTRLYLRPLDRFESTVVAESEGAQQPFFSPDGSKVAFFARGKLLTAPVSGGPPTPITDAAYATFGGTWGEDGTIVYVPTLMSGLMRVPAAGGKAETMTDPDGASRGYAHVFPQFLPGGRTVIFTVWGGRNQELRGVGLIPLGSKEWNKEPAPAAVGQYSYAPSGHLLGSGDRGGVTAIPFDPEHPVTGGEQTLVVEDVFSSPGINLSWFATSDTGTLVHVPGNPNLGTLAWVDRQGVVTPLAGTPSTLVDPALSPDGTRVVLGQATTLWVLELRRSTLTRLTLDGEGFNMVPSWTPDGARVMFASNRNGDWDIYSVSASGGPASRVLERKGIQFPLTSAPDGTLLFSERSRGTGTDFFLLSTDGTVKPFLVSPFSKVGAEFSPDGRAVAYVSNETGREEVYVRSAARPGDVVTVSTEGGIGPRWSPDGKELFYRRGESFFVASVGTDPVSVGDSQKLFDLRASTGRTQQNPGYGVSPDGQRFLVLLPDARAIPTQINVVLNWFEELKVKVPPR